MSKVLVSETNLMNIAEAIRRKTGETAKMKPAEMAGKIEGIQTGGGEDSLGAYLGLQEGALITSNVETIKLNNFIGDYYGAKIGKASFYFPKLTTWQGNTTSYFVSGDNGVIVDRLDCPLLDYVNCDSIFSNCTFGTVNLPKLNKIGTRWFIAQSTFKQEVLNLPRLSQIYDLAFHDCTGFKTLNIGTELEDTELNGNSKVGNQAFAIYRKTPTLETVKIKTKSIASNSFKKNTTLSTFVILNKDAVVTMESTTCFDETAIANGTGSIYVPDALVEQYKVATNWAIYADQIKPLSEYTEA